MGGPDNQIFNNKDLIKLSKDKKIKIVTHHWSSNYLKGMDIYKQLDELLLHDEWGSKLEFTYIGNLSDDVVFKKTIIPALSDIQLANELKIIHLSYCFQKRTIRKPPYGRSDDGSSSVVY